VLGFRHCTSVFVEGTCSGGVHHASRWCGGSLAIVAHAQPAKSPARIGFLHSFTINAYDRSSSRRSDGAWRTRPHAEQRRCARHRVDHCDPNAVSELLQRGVDCWCPVVQALRWRRAETSTIPILFIAVVIRSGWDLSRAASPRSERDRFTTYWRT